MIREAFVRAQIDVWRCLSLETAPVETDQKFCFAASVISDNAASTLLDGRPNGEKVFVASV